MVLQSGRLGTGKIAVHVAHFTHRYPPALGGAEAYVERLSRYMSGGGDDVTVWTSTATDLEAMWRTGREEPAGARRQDGVEIRRFRPARFPGRRYVLKAASLVPVPRWQAVILPCNPVCPGMWRDVGRFDGPLDAVHAFAFPYSFPAACGLRLARRRGVPFFLTPFLHLGDPADPRDRTRRQYTSRPLRWLLRQADRVFVQTPSEQRAVTGLGVADDRVTLQGLGVDTAGCTGGDRAATRRAWGVRDGEPVVGHLANNSEEKGTVDLLRAAAKTWAAGGELRVVLAGPEMPNFRRFWDKFEPKHRVTRLGPLTDGQKRDFFAGIDAFALPSRSDSFGLVLLEAWANGKPCVCYRAGGPADLVRDCRGGLLAACGDVDGLASALRRIAENGTLRTQLGRAGLARMREFRWPDKLRIVRDTLVSTAGGVHPAPHPHETALVQA